ncbi:hypothetical protein PAEPH01_2959 [Pancytospora epiphaga]|nr:hypothetical protein PAEPH01_2959 [Pancytospora epiphaga]
MLPTLACSAIHAPKIRLFLIYLYTFVYGLFDCATTADVDKLRPLSKVLHELHGTLNRETYTFKAHVSLKLRG